MKLWSLAALLALSVIPATAALAQGLSFLPPPFQQRIADAAADCAGFGGILTLRWGFVSRPELSGDGQRDWAMDERRFECSTTPGLYCGTGGCPVQFLIDGISSDLLAKQWRVIRFGGAPVVVAYVHGSQCGGTNLNRCVAAQIWENGQWNVVGGAIP